MVLSSKDCCTVMPFVRISSVESSSRWLGSVKVPCWRSRLRDATIALWPWLICPDRVADELMIPGMRRLSSGLRAGMQAQIMAMLHSRPDQIAIWTPRTANVVSTGCSSSGGRNYKAFVSEGDSRIPIVRVAEQLLQHRPCDAMSVIEVSWVRTEGRLTPHQPQRRP